MIVYSSLKDSAIFFYQENLATYLTSIIFQRSGV